MYQSGSLPHAVLPSSSQSVSIIVQQNDQPASPTHHDSSPTLSSSHASTDSARNTIFNKQSRSSLSLSDITGSQGDTASIGHKLCTNDGKSGLTRNGSAGAVRRRGRNREIIKELPNGGGFMMADGEVYSSFGVGSNGSPIVCNGKGCRPLSPSEIRSLNHFTDNSRSSGLRGDHTQMVSSKASLQSYYERTLMENYCSCRNNPLFLKNFAQFLYKVEDDAERAEEYYGRAILAAGTARATWSENEDDDDGDGGHTAGEALSEYATLIWQVYGDQERAESYFQRSVEAAPDDSCVLASHASFLWEVDEEES